MSFVLSPSVPETEMDILESQNRGRSKAAYHKSSPVLPTNGCTILPYRSSRTDFCGYSGYLGDLLGPRACGPARFGAWKTISHSSHLPSHDDSSMTEERNQGESKPAATSHLCRALKHIGSSLRIGFVGDNSRETPPVSLKRGCTSKCEFVTE